MIQPAPIWQSNYDKLPRDARWYQHIAKWYAKHACLEPVRIKGEFLFEFNQGAFAARLLRLRAVFSSLEGAKQMADAWMSSIKASVITLQPGASIGIASPPTTFSKVEVLWNEPMLKAAYGKLVQDLQRMKFPQAMHRASMSLGIDATGMDSTVPIILPLQVQAECLQ